MSTPASKGTFHTLRGKNNSCPICGSNDGRCREFVWYLSNESEIYCMNSHYGDCGSYRFMRESSADGGTWGVYKLDNLLNQPTPIKRRTIKPLSVANLTPKERDTLYRFVIEQLELSAEDREDLLRRGLSDSEIKETSFRTCHKSQRLKKPVSPNLPGVDKSGEKLLTSGDGWLCPVKDVSGSIVGCQVRLRDKSSNKYRWLSTNGNYRINGEPPLAVYRGDDFVASLVEGLAAKPLLTHKHTGSSVIGASGGCFGASKVTLLQSLEVIDPLEVRFYPDAGSVINPNVLQQYENLFGLLSNYTVKIGWWEQRQKLDGDIDELATLQDVRYISQERFWKIARDEALRVYFTAASNAGLRPEISEKSAIQLLRDAKRIEIDRDINKYRVLVKSLLTELDTDWRNPVLINYLESQRIERKQLRLFQLRQLKQALESALTTDGIIKIA